MTSFESYPIYVDGSPIKGTPESEWGELLAAQVVKDYEEQVIKILKVVNKKGSVGHKVLSRLPFNKKIVIQPYLLAEAAKTGYCNALVRQPDATALAEGKVIVRYSPSMWKSGGTCAHIAGPGSAADELLLHELLHAFRHATGRLRRVAFTKPDKSYTNSEEFFSIVVTNVYMSELGKSQLRKDHSAFHPLPSKWATSKGFLDDPDFRPWIEHYYWNEHALCSRLADHQKGTFNPFREFKAWLKANGQSVDTPSTK